MNVSYIPDNMSCSNVYYNTTICTGFLKISMLKKVKGIKMYSRSEYL